MTATPLLKFPTASPPAYPGTQLTGDLDRSLPAIATMFQSDTAPTSLSLGIASLAGIWWHDTSGLPTSSTIKLRNQNDDAWILIGTIDETNDIFQVSLATSSRELNSASPNLHVLASDNCGQILCNANGGDLHIIFNPTPGVLPDSMQVTFIKTDASTNTVYVSNGVADYYQLTQQGDSVIIAKAGAALQSIGTPPNV